MRYLVILGAILSVIIAGCDTSTDDPATTSPAIVQQPESSESLTGQNEEAAAEGEDEARPELVEESAAVPDETQSSNEPIRLARNDAAQQQDWKFTEGQHFHRLVPTQPTVGGPDKIEVAEIFWYGCNHCLNFEPYINRWAENKPPDVRFVRIPAMWNPLVTLHAQLYYTEQVLADNGQLEDPQGFHAAVFQEYHGRGNRLASENAIQALFERFGVGEDDFRAAWNSFEVDQKMRVARDLADRYDVTGVPAIVVNGKYRTGGAEAGGYPQLLEVIDELVAREVAR